MRSSHRKIVVQNRTFIWTIRNDYYFYYGDGRAVAIRELGRPGYLRVRNMPEPVTPGMMAAVLNSALNQGWDSSARNQMIAWVDDAFTCRLQPR